MNYTVRIFMLMSISWISLHYAITFPPKNADFDCADVAHAFKHAQLYFNAKNDYKPLGFTLLQHIHQKCKNTSPDRVSLALVTFKLGHAYWYGDGVARDQFKACDYFNEILKEYPDIKKDEVVPWSQFYIADGTRASSHESKNGPKAVELYKNIIDNPEPIDSNLRAWAQARLADAYREGNGIEQDDAKSVQLFQTILNNDSVITDKSVVAWAKFWIADAYQLGKSVVLDWEKAQNLFMDIVDNYHQVDPIAVEHALERLKAMQDFAQKLKNIIR